MKRRIPIHLLWRAILWISLVCSVPIRAYGQTPYGVAADGDSIVISEIMYHPGHAANTAENLKLEWIELFNRGAVTVNLAGWRFSDGVEFVFPAVSIGAGRYLVVAADASAFKAKYPGAISVVGGWTGWLSNSGEKIELADQLGEVVDSVKYADEGDWAVRELGPVDAGHRGWQWSDAHDGGGRSLELISAAMPNEYGQNWTASLLDGGTPGVPSAVVANDIAPLILDVGHGPVIPGPADAVTVTASIRDEQATGLIVTLRYRLDASTYTNQDTYPQFNAASYLAIPMRDDGLHGDKRAADGVFGGQIPAQANGKIIEFYVEARDGGGMVRTWPAPSMVDGAPRQVTNALYQVDSSFDPTWVPGSLPIYYIIMTEMERGRLAYFSSGGRSSLSGPNSQMNATFISLDGTGVEVRYGVGVRNRGHGTRNGPPNNYHVALAGDRPWNGRSAVNFNCRNPPCQIMGSAIFRMAGFAAPRAMPARLRINGANLATTNMYGVYVRLDAFDDTYAKADFCDDPDGNLYSCFRDNGEADLLYRGTNPNSYRPSYFKESNASRDDWSDLIHMTDVLNNAPEATYFQDVSKVINVSYWLRYIALDSLLMNNETGLNSGIGDDYFMYRGVTDPRFVLIPHDLDTILDSGGNVNGNIFAIVNGGGNYNGVDGLRRFFNHPEITARYHQAMLDVMNEFFNPETLDPLFVRVLGGFAPASRIEAMKQRIRQRIAAVRTQIPQKLTVNSTVPLASGFRRTTEGNYAISGTANPAQTRSVAINGKPGTWTATNGTWQSGGASGITESLVNAGSEWKYLDDGSNQGTAWYSPGFDDSAWRSGRAELGYGDGDEATVVNSGPTSSRYITTYFRKSFAAVKARQYFTLRLRMLCDDGAIVYLNGVEVCRTNLPGGAVNYQTLASTSLGGADEDAFNLYDVSPAFVQEGLNTLAVEVHQNAASSSDISFNLALEGTKRGIDDSAVLAPGINRIVVQSFDSFGGVGHKLEESYVDLWYDTGVMSEISGTLGTDTVLDAAGGPWRVTGTLTVPADITLTIDPGATLFFNPNAGLTVYGRVVAAGTVYQNITLTRAPDSLGRWAGVQFLNTSEESRLIYVNMEYGDAGDGAIRADSASVYLDHVTWANHTKPYLVFDNSSMVLRNSVLPSLQNAALVHFGGLPSNGHALFEGNRFGGTTGSNNVIDLSGGERPGPIARFLNNTFTGAGDGCLNLDGADAHIEGNVFMNVHGGTGNSSPSHAITTGTQDGRYSRLTVARNLFYDVDHALLAKDGGYITAVNNTVVRAALAGVNMYEARAGQSQGKGFYGDGNIFCDVAHLFENPDWGGHPTAITMNNSVFPVIDGDPVVWTGAGNLEGVDPQLLRATDVTDPKSDLRLLPTSPALGTGPNGRDMGGMVASGASVSGEPSSVTWRTTATLTVGGPDIHAYKYRVNDEPWSEEVPRPEAGLAANPKPLPPIVLTGLQDGESYTVYVLGKDSAGVWQSESRPTISRPWTVETAYRQVVINEVLASNKSALKHDNAYPDVVELYYDGPTALSLAGMSLTDDPLEPRRFIFGAVTMNPGKYLVLYADTGGTASAPHLGFGLKTEGGGVYLYDKAGALVDAVEYGAQLPDLSIGRVGSLGQWRLAVPTFGQANVARPLGDPRAVRLNEWLASSEVLLSSDFIELYNSHADPVDLGGMYLTDSPALLACMHLIRPLTFLAGQGYGVFWADDSNEPGHVDFRLSADGGLIALYDAQAKVVDKIFVGAQTTDFSEGRAPDGTPNLAIFPLPTPGLANPQVQKTNTTTIALVEERANKRVLVPTRAVNDAWKGGGTFDDSTWQLGAGTPGGVGYETGTGYQTLITVDTRAQMYGTGKNSSCFIRIPFTVEQRTLADISKLTLQMRYDDAFVAYLNGTEIARAGFTGTLAWNSAAGTDHPDADAVVFEPFDVTARLNLLRTGQNLLALHGLDGASSSDFLISAVLEATSVKGTSQNSRDQELKLLDGLRITELMYRAPKGTNYDYLELKNILTETLDLTGVRFDKGVDFTFPTLILQPGETVVLAASQSAFRSAYGATPKVVGQYNGNLSDTGEKIVVLLPAPLDVAILRFDYTAARWPGTDGAGQSLTIRDPEGPPVLWNDPEGWSPANPTPGR